MHVLQSSLPRSRPLLLISADAPARLRAELVLEADAQRVSVVRLDRADRASAIDSAARSCAAATIVVCGPGWIQARVAAVACGRDIPFACIPLDEHDLLARDLGARLGHAAGSLSRILEGDEHALDLGEVNGVTFVNYVAIGRGRGLGDGGVAAGAAGGCGAHLDPLGRDAPAAVLVTNNQFSFEGERPGARVRVDGGLLGVAVRRAGARAWWRPASGGAAAPGARAHLELFADDPLLADVDGWPYVLSAPLRFRVLAGALRCVRPSHRAG